MLPRHTPSTFSMRLILLILIMLIGTTWSLPSIAQELSTEAIPDQSSSTESVQSVRSDQYIMSDLPVFGVETSSGKITESRIERQARNLGVTWIRLNTLSWREIQPTPDDEYDWSAPSAKIFEDEIRAANSLNLIPIAIVDDFPHWATISENSCAAIKTEHFADYARYLQAVVQRYGAPPYGVQYWEIGNEVDIAPSLVGPDNAFGCWGDIIDPYYGGEHYGEMLKVVTPAIKEVDPDAQVLIGGLLLDRPNTTNPGRGKPEHFFEGILRAGAHDSFDIVAYHSYPWFNGRSIDGDLDDSRWQHLGGSALGKAAFLREVMQRYDVDKPLFLNEGALLQYEAFHNDEFFETQADHIVRVLARIMADNIQLFCWYTLHQSGWYSGGLLDSNDQPRPPYYAYQNFINQTSGSQRPVSVEDYGTTIEAYRFKRAAYMVDVLWSREPTTKRIEFPSDVFIAAYDRDGAQLQPVQDGSNFIIDVGFTPMYIWHSAGPISWDPQIFKVEPYEAYNDRAVELTIHGQWFVYGTTVAIERSNDRHRIPLADTTFVDTTKMTAIVPVGAAPGFYDAVITLPNNHQGRLEHALEILEADPTHPPKIFEARPDYGLADLPHHVNVYGSNFLRGDLFGIDIGGVDGQTTWLRGSHAYATFPANAFNHQTTQVYIYEPEEPPEEDIVTSQVYTITVTNANGSQGIAPHAYVNYAPGEEDLFGYSYELWTDPIAPRIGDEVTVGLHIHRPNRTTTNEIVRVRFCLGDPTQQCNLIGDEMVSLASSTATLPMSGVTWAPAEQTTYTVYAQIDPDEDIPEVFETNNIVSRTIPVLPASVDQDIPQMHAIDINNGQRQTDNREITLTIDASDPAPTSGLAWIFVMEYEYSPATERWWPQRPLHPVASDWKPFQPTTTWYLSGAPGTRYLYVWVADAAGNVSDPVGTSIIYEQPGATVQTTPPAGSQPDPRIALPSVPEISDRLIHTFYLPIVRQETSQRRGDAQPYSQAPRLPT